MSDGVEIRVGLDIVDLERFRKAVDRWGPRFLNRIFTPAELGACRGRTASLAARFAAREAFAKALGVGVRGFHWREVAVLTAPSGKPELVLEGDAARAAAQANWRSAEVSLSHTARTAAAVVVALVYPGGRG